CQHIGVFILKKPTHEGICWVIIIAVITLGRELTIVKFFYSGTFRPIVVGDANSLSNTLAFLCLAHTCALAKMAQGSTLMQPEWEMNCLAHSFSHTV
ncbi:hypothetical protein ACJX0J_031943, partial [Zea mays]